MDLCKSKYKFEEYTKAIPYCVKACNLDSSDGCYGLSQLYANGNGVPQDLEAAKKYSAKACSLGEEKACEK